MVFKEMLGYSEEKELLGTLVEYSQLTKKATLQHGNKTTVVSAEGLIIIDKIGKINDTNIYEMDIFEEVYSELKEKFLISLDGNTVILHALNKKLEKIGEVLRHPLNDIDRLFSRLKLLGNYYELVQELKTVDFNISIVKSKLNEYFYAGNRKEESEVDLIKVVYLGSSLLVEEDYQRKTVSHEEFLEAIELGLFVEVSPEELTSYVFKQMSKTIVEDKEPCYCGDECECAYKEEYEKDKLNFGKKHEKIEMCSCGERLEEDCIKEFEDCDDLDISGYESTFNKTKKITSVFD